MSEDQRDKRLAEEHLRLKSLRGDSTIFDFEAQGDPPAKYIITFRGQGISRSLSSASDIEKVDLHRCEVRLPYAFPKRPPDIRWITPMHHPNVSFSGLVKLRDVGLPWEEDLSLDIICERLWDMARLAFYDEQKATNYAARNWLAEQDEIKLPVDHRPLRDKETPFSSNVVKYERRGPKSTNLKHKSGSSTPIGGRRARQSAPASAPRSAAQQDDILFIGEETPSPTKRPRQNKNDDDDVMYIGYE